MNKFHWVCLKIESYELLFSKFTELIISGSFLLLSALDCVF